MKPTRTLAIVAALGALGLPAAAPADTAIPSLDALTIEALRGRSYEAMPALAGTIDCPSRGGEGEMLGYSSDGLGVYARLARPETAAPEGGYPVVVFLHGWVGEEAAPGYEFSCNDGGYYAEFINTWADAGYVVLMPGFRGHGTVAGAPAEGIEYLAAWDNGSYLSPVFYTLDALNLIAAIPAIGGLDLPGGPLPLNAARVHVAGHSQGGDVAAMVLAATGEGAANGLSVASGSIWAGTFMDRFTQLETYRPMERATQAWLAGDGTWTGTATGADGSVNPDFVFGYPPNWIGTLDQSEWTWQADFWNEPSVRAAVETKLGEMYAAINQGAGDMGDLAYEVTDVEGGTFAVTHDPRLVEAMAGIGAVGQPQWISEPVALHFSDRDFYSIPAWNHTLCDAINAEGGACRAWEYPGTTHTLRVADQDWFSPAGTEDGFPVMLRRDAALFADGGHDGIE